MIGIGVDSFSYHRFFGEFTPWEKPLDTRWTTEDFLARASALGVRRVSLQTVYLPEPTAETVAALRDGLARHQLQPTLAWGHRSGLEGGASPEKVEAMRAWLPAARTLGCSVMRVTCGDQTYWRIPASERIARLTPILDAIAREAADYGLTVAVENHADFSMGDLVTLVDRVGADKLGICFDSGNAVRVGDDLLEAAALAAKHVKMVHLKDMIVVESSRGDPAAWWPSAPLGRGQFDLPALIALLAKADFDGTLFIEMTNMHPDWADEDAAVAESVRYLRRLLSGETGAVLS